MLLYSKYKDAGCFFFLSVWLERVPEKCVFNLNILKVSVMFLHIMYILYMLHSVISSPGVPELLYI